MVIAVFLFERLFGGARAKNCKKQDWMLMHLG
jgi:hypothetical protein